MTAQGVADEAWPDRAAARRGRKLIRRWAPEPLAAGLRLLEEQLEDSARARLYVMGGAGAAIGRAMQSAHARAGRTLVELIFALHEWAARGRPAGLTAESFVGVEPRPSELVRLAPPPGTACARIFVGLIDSFSERLTLHRYPGPERRQRHARLLIAEPLHWILIGEGAAADAAEDHDAIEARTRRAAVDAEHLLRLWDLTQADRLAEMGFNRLVDDTGADRWGGGFFALADQSIPPGADDIRAAADRLLADIRADRAGDRGIHPSFKCLDPLPHLVHFAEQPGRAAWPGWPRIGRKPGVRHALLRWFAGC